MMQGIDKSHRIKILLVASAIAIVIVSLIVSHFLVRDLAIEEKGRVQMWAQAMRSLNSADEHTDLNLVLTVINENHTIPVIVLDANNRAQIFRNVNLLGDNRKDSLNYASSLGALWKSNDRCIHIVLNDSTRDFVQVCYDDSVLIKRLEVYPYIQLAVVFLFVVFAIFFLKTSKKSEQNSLWVGLSKETAHQLGTPISSMMAWIEILKDKYPQDDMILEMGYDVNRLRLIADRFSKIGSLPESQKTNLNTLIADVVDYMNRRTSRNIVIKKDFPDTEVFLNMNANLFGWVLENLLKNAIDAIGGANGCITISLQDQEQTVIVDVTDSGKGIPAKDFKHVFAPGFTTKSRGWGLGLSLAKRIVEEYHHGKIFVKSSEIGLGTTFRIELKKY